MEQEVTDGESEIFLLREKIQSLSDHIDVKKSEHQSEMQRLSKQLKQAHSNIVSQCQNSFQSERVTIKMIQNGCSCKNISDSYVRVFIFPFFII